MKVQEIIHGAKVTLPLGWFAQGYLIANEPAILLQKMPKLKKEAKQEAVSYDASVFSTDSIPKLKYTKTGYEKVNFEDTMGMFGDEVEIESDLFFQWSENNVVHVSEVSGRDLIMNRHKLVRKIETPIEWWEDAAELVKPLGHSEIVNDQLLVEAAMTRDQWCDFARILLEQGE